jgi:5-methylcytosine-specific restriction endonuclease McrA
VVDRALTVLIATLQKVKHAATAPPRTSAAASSKGRYISAAVRREVWKRDGAQCAFVGPAGRCTERGFLEFHHVVPYADGGGKTVQNIELRCRAHNGYEAERWFGTGEDLVREEAVPYSVTCQPLGRNYLAEPLGPDRAGMKYPKLAGQPVWSFD